ncbi:MAG: tape measure protein, partial [Burkholderiales bacterium]|nr:tape measure protein [Burkholderiales bacterium]
MTTYSVGVQLDIASRGLDNIQALLAELDKSGAVTAQFRQRAFELGQQLQRLGAEQGLIDAFRRSKEEAQAAARAYAEAQQRAQQLGRELAATEAPTRRQAAALEAARQAVRNAAEANVAQQRSLQDLRAQLAAAGIASDQLASAQSRVRQQTADVQAQQGRLAADLRLVAQQSVAAGNAAQAAGKQAQRAFADAAAETQRFGTGLENVGARLQAAFAAAGLTVTAQGLARVADEYSNILARLRLTEGSAEAARAGLARVLEVAQQTNTSLDATATLYTRIAASGSELGLSNQQVLGLVQTINQAIQVSGAGAQESEAAVRQLVQGLQSGVLRGEEFNSVMEQAPRLARALADGLGVPLGALRSLAEQGRLTTDAVVRALQTQRGAIEQEFAVLPDTVGRAAQRVRNAWLEAIGALDQTRGISATAAGALDSLARNMGALVTVAEAAGNAIITFLGVRALGALLEFSRRGGGALGSLRDAITQTEASFGALGRAVSLVQAAFVGWQIGSFLNNFAVVRQAGVLMSRGLIEAIELVRLSWDSLAAAFTSDTIDAAVARYQQRIGQARQILREQLADAGRDVQPVASALETVGNAAQTQAERVSELAKQFPLLAQAITPVGEAGKTAAAGVADIGAAAAKAGSDIDKLSVDQLAKLGSEAQRAFAAGKISAAEFDQALRLVAGGSAKALGVELGDSMLGITNAFRQSLVALDLLEQQFDSLQRRGVDASAATAQAIDNLTSRAKNRADLDALVARVEDLGKAGIISGDQVVEALTKIKARTDELTPGINSVGEAYKALGITSQAELAKAANAAREAFEVLRTGRVPLQDLQAAFDKYAQSQVAAFGESRRVYLEEQAAVLGLVPTWSKVAEAARGAGAEGAAAGRAIAAGITEAGRAADEAARRVAQLAEQLRISVDDAAQLQERMTRLRTDVEGFSLNTAGNRVAAAGRTEEQARLQINEIIRNAFGAAALGDANAQQFARNQLRIQDFRASIEQGSRAAGLGGGQISQDLTDLLVRLERDNQALAGLVTQGLAGRQSQPTQPSRAATP